MTLNWGLCLSRFRLPRFAFSMKVDLAKCLTRVFADLRRVFHGCFFFLSQQRILYTHHREIVYAASMYNYCKKEKVILSKQDAVVTHCCMLASEVRNYHTKLF